MSSSQVPKLAISDPSEDTPLSKASPAKPASTNAETAQPTSNSNVEKPLAPSHPTEAVPESNSEAPNKKRARETDDDGGDAQKEAKKVDLKTADE